MRGLNPHWLRSGLTVLGALAFIGFLTVVLRPIQQDSGHVVGFFDAGGGRVLHPAEFTLYRAFAGDYTLIITGKLADPISGDIAVDLTGEQPVDWTLYSRNPPAIPLYNYNRAWYHLEGSTIKNVSPGDNLILYLKMHIPIAAGHYHLAFTNPETGQSYLTVPISFHEPGGLQPISSGDDCH